jgi:uncharacterized protein
MLYDLTSFLDSHDITYQFEGGLDSEPINDGIDINILNPIRFNGTIFKVDSELQLNCNIIYRFEANCDRCLKPIVTDFSTVLSGKLKDIKGKFNDEDESDEIIYFENNLLDLKKYIWSQVVSSLPMKILCSEDCKGLCPICGVDLNNQSCDCMGNTIDPRLEKLKELFPKK